MLDPLLLFQVPRDWTNVLMWTHAFVRVSYIYSIRCEGFLESPAAPSSKAPIQFWVYQTCLTSFFNLIISYFPKQSSNGRPWIQLRFYMFNFHLKDKISNISVCVKWNITSCKHCWHKVQVYSGYCTAMNAVSFVFLLLIKGHIDDFALVEHCFKIQIFHFTCKNTNPDYI